MMLEKLRRQQEQANSQSPSNQGVGNQNRSGGHLGGSHQPSVNNYYIQVPRYPYPGYYNRYPATNPYGYSYGGGYGGYYGDPYSSGPIIYPPAVNVVPHGVPLTPQMLNGTYGVPVYPINPYGVYGRVYGDFGALPNQAPQPNVAVAPNFGRQPAGGNPPVMAPVPPQVQGDAAQAPMKLPQESDEIRRRVAALKPSTDAGRLRADEILSDGDREFRDQQYRRAAAKYRDAIAKAPDYAASHFRAGHAYIATGDYELAVTYFAMAFELSRTIDRPGFSLADLYRGNELAKDQQLEALADAVLRQPNDGGLLFLTGLTQHYDGHPLQARDYFRRAAAMPGRHQPYAAMFVPKPAEGK